MHGLLGLIRIILKDSLQVCNVGRGQAEGVQFAQFCVSRNPRQRRFEAAKGSKISEITEVSSELEGKETTGITLEQWQ
jgi:hypothetical protein